MTREILDRRIHFLQDEVLSLGSLVEENLLDSLKALRNGDLSLAGKVVNRDGKVNDRRFAIEDACITLIATQQPMARDLRVLAAILEVITELERMGDYAKGIGHIVTLLKGAAVPENLLDLFDSMAAACSQMLQRALRAFVMSDDKAARRIPLDDDTVDHLYNLVYRSLIEGIACDPEQLDRSTHLLWVAHNLERFADRVSNICERTIFTATGELLELRDTHDELGLQDLQRY